MLSTRHRAILLSIVLVSACGSHTDELTGDWFMCAGQPPVTGCHPVCSDPECTPFLSSGVRLRADKTWVLLMGESGLLGKSAYYCEVAAPSATGVYEATAGDLQFWPGTPNIPLNMQLESDELRLVAPWLPDYTVFFGAVEPKSSGACVVQSVPVKGWTCHDWSGRSYYGGSDSRGTCDAGTLTVRCTAYPWVELAGCYVDGKLTKVVAGFGICSPIWGLNADGIAKTCSWQIN